MSHEHASGATCNAPVESRTDTVLISKLQSLVKPGWLLLSKGVGASAGRWLVHVP